MEKYTHILQSIPLFQGIASGDYPALLSCLGTRIAHYGKGEFASLRGDTLHAVGIVLDGRVQVIKEDVFGNRAILNDLDVGSVFGESFVCGGNYALSVSVQTAESSTILFLPFDKVMQTCPNACGFHSMLIKNMVVMIARKNIRLVEKLEITTKRSLREKILSYLSHLAQEQRSSEIKSPLGRVDLADFLGVDRSALTRELNRMAADGVIAYSKNTFTLLGVAVLHGE